MSDPPINCSIFPKALQQNIKVAIRVKPLLDEQLARGQEDSPSASGGIAQDSCCVSIHSPVSLSVNSAKSVKDFTFDSIYGPDASQADVYGIVSDLVEKAIEGYNVCVSFEIFIQFLTILSLICSVSRYSPTVRLELERPTQCQWKLAELFPKLPLSSFRQ